MSAMRVLLLCCCVFYGRRLAFADTLLRRPRLITASPEELIIANLIRLPKPELVTAAQIDFSPKFDADDFTVDLFDTANTSDEFMLWSSKQLRRRTAKRTHVTRNGGGSSTPPVSLITAATLTPKMANADPRSVYVGQRRPAYMERVTRRPSKYSGAEGGRAAAGRSVEGSGSGSGERPSSSAKNTYGSRCGNRGRGVTNPNCATGNSTPPSGPATSTLGTTPPTTASTRRTRTTSASVTAEVTTATPVAATTATAVANSTTAFSLYRLLNGLQFAKVVNTLGFGVNENDEFDFEKQDGVQVLGLPIGHEYGVRLGPRTGLGWGRSHNYGPVSLSKTRAIDWGADSVFGSWIKQLAAIGRN